MNMCNRKDINLHRLRRGHNLGSASEQDLTHSQPMAMINEAASNRCGLLFIHGYSSTPYSMRPLANALLKDVYFTMIPCLAGHAQTPEAMSATTYQDWYQSIKCAYQKLEDHCDRIIVVGQSLGALLAVMLAAEFPHINQLILLAPAFYPPSIINFTPILTPLLKLLGMPTITNIGGTIAKEDSYEITYHKIHVNCPRELYRACIKARQLLPLLSLPITVIASSHDPIIKPKGIKKAYNHIRSKPKELIWVDNSAHVISCDNDQAQIIAIIRQQLSAHIKE